MLARLLATTSVLLLTNVAGAQSGCATPSISVGSERERYLRVAQLLHAAQVQPWTLRSFSPVQAIALQLRDSTLPGSAFVAPRTKCARRPAFSWLPADAHAIYNSGFPFGHNDGAVWAGRGATTSVQAGFTTNFSALSIAVQPLAFITQNSDFPIVPNGLTGRRSFASWRYPKEIDLPQRFGNEAYGRFDPGQSEVRFDARGVAIGVSSKNQFWGPATDHPIILGNNAAGIPRLFIGTSRPARIKRFGTLHGQLFWGAEGQSAYSALTDSSFSRLASGLIVVYQPALLSGMEVGAARFFHVLQRRFNLNTAELTRPFGSLLLFDFAKQSQVIAQGDNQLASLFFRFVSPADGMEFYAELGREDHANTLRELLLIPDHDMAYLVGLQKAWRSERAVTAFRSELLNSRVTHLSLSSQQSPFYQHSAVSQGHTNYGQALGSVAAHGGGASIVAVERYSNKGRTTVSWERLEMGQNGLPGRPTNPAASEVQNVVALERFWLGKAVNRAVRLAIVHETNRYVSSEALAVHTHFTISLPNR